MVTLKWVADTVNNHYEVLSVINIFIFDRSLFPEMVNSTNLGRLKEEQWRKSWLNR